MLYFLRHGQTAYSKTGGYCGKIENDPGLTPEGYQMAQSFAQAYLHLSWNAIYVSPLYRTRETIRPLCHLIRIGSMLVLIFTANAINIIFLQGSTQYPKDMLH